ncbi:hypothetical protein [Agromyces aerolatus]|uniref:hypothetical protein n=1 Tax=Agromyces sp. LY-1074 TaxID=3074080 RepID=UPI002855D702|nr:MULTISPECIES: hypothetical protein [unclassified Agromyces]MDR5700943.1 hypothetical protein [Agromyces sp. LY-1074]MDR5707396.1 hypothetical protein [Agromyces sp. LY-1358]
MSPPDVILIGALLLALVTVESGGWFLTRVVRGLAPANALQTGFFRAGHAHAGVLLILSIAVLGVIHAAALDGFWLWLARVGVPIAAILMPAGFFLSVLGRDPKRPNALIVLVWIGAGLLAAALVTAGIGLIAGGVADL